MILPEYSDNAATHLNVAIEHVQKAIEYDMNQSHSKACVGYLESLPHFMLAFKQESNVGMRSLIVQKMKEYLDRIDVLKRKPLMDTDTISHGLRVELVRRPSMPPGFPTDGHDYDHDDASAPKVQWSDIVGHEYPQNTLRESILLPIKFPQHSMNKDIPNVILLYGPPGSGKRMLVEALVTDVAKLCSPRFVTLRCVDFVANGRRVEEVAASLKEVFQHTRPEFNSGGRLTPTPTLILIDGPEALYSYPGCDVSAFDAERLRSIRTELLYHVDRSSSFPGMFVVFSSRAPWEIHPVLGIRFRKRIFVPLPGQEERMEMLKRFISVSESGNSLSGNEYAKLCQMTDGYSGRDILAITLDARIQPLRRELVAFGARNGFGFGGHGELAGGPRTASPAICMADYVISLVGTRPVDQRYVEWSNRCDTT